MKRVIKKLTVKDLPKVILLLSAALHEDFPEYQPRIANAYIQIFNKKYFRTVLKKKTNILFGIFDQKKLTGFIGLVGNVGGVVFVDWLVVDKDYRKKGIGTALLQKAETWAINHKHHHEYLYTENMRYVHFYEGRGFKFVGIQKKSWFGADEYLMYKILRNVPFKEVFTKYEKKTL